MTTSLSDEYDLAVIGGGPAGTAAAITAARNGARVILFEAGAFPRHKVCGEFISPEALSILRQLLMSERYALLAQHAPRIREIRLIRDGSSEVTLALSGSALSIPRYDLDAALWEAATAAGVDCRDRMRVDSADKTDGGWRVSCAGKDFCARHAILATGRWSNLPRRQSPSRSNLWMGLKAQFYETDPAASCDLYFFRGGYCGVQPVGVDRVNVAVMVRSDVAKSLSEAFARHGGLAKRSEGWTPVFDPMSCAPLVHAKPSASLDGALLAGDAAAFLDPFVGDGISLALHSGCLAGETIGRSPERAAEAYDRDYQQKIAPLFRSVAWVRALLTAPALVQQAALGLLRMPPVQKRIIAATRMHSQPVRD